MSKKNLAQTFINPIDSGKFDSQLAVYCWLHPTMQPRNREKVKMRPFKRMDDGKLIMGRSCPKCGNTVFVDQEKARNPEVKIEGYSQDQKGDIQNV